MKSHGKRIIQQPGGSRRKAVFGASTWAAGTAAIRQARRIVIAAHIKPDGDTLGAMMALGLGLEKLKKTVTFLCADRIPAAYSALPAMNRVVRHTRASYDAAITVDVSKKEMLGAALAVIQRCPVSIEIDHHQLREPFAALQLVDVSACAMGEIIYRLLRVLGIEPDAAIATHLLTSLVVETNAFRLPCVSAEAFRLCARLLACGVNFYDVSEAVYWSRTRATVVLSGLALSRCRFYDRGTIVWSMLRHADFIRHDGTHADTDAVADDMRAIKNVEVAVLFREEPGSRLRVSLRAKRCVNVGIIAERFGGGGHPDVAGCIIEATVSARQRLLRDIRRQVALDCPHRVGPAAAERQ